MKSWTLSFRVEDKRNFDQLKDGSKPIETRAATAKYQPVEIGDELVFVCYGEQFSRRVTNKEHFRSVDEMAEKIHFQDIMPWVESVEEMKKAYSAYPGYDEKIKEFGIFAFYLE